MVAPAATRSAGLICAMILDAHVHLYPPEVNRDPAAWAAACDETHWMQLCTRRRKTSVPVQGFPSVEQLLRDMDAAGVARSVLLGWYWQHADRCRLQNRFYAECVQRHPDRLSAFATLHPGAGLEQTLDEISWAHDAGLIGLGELSPHAQGYGVNNPVFHAVLDRAGRLGLPVNLHVTDPLSRPYPGRVETPLKDFVRLAQAFPATSFILAHWGGGLAWSAEAAALPNVWFDTAASPLLYGPEVWKKVTSKRVLFGSDYPLILYPLSETAPTSGGLLAEARAEGVTSAVLGGNAAKLFGR